MKIKKLVYTFGCKVNQVESEEIEASLNEYDTSAVAIINSCTVTSRADTKCRQLIRRLINENPDFKIVLTGCYIERDKKNIEREFPSVFIVSNIDKLRIMDVLKLDKKNVIKKKARSRTRAFLKIQDGCDAFCAYCIVPYVRSDMRSKNITDIKTEVEEILKSGYKEIVLTGVRVGMFNSVDDNKCEWRLSDLIMWLNKKSGVERIRISSIEPLEITNDLIEVMRKAGYPNGKLCPHLHISFQSGDDLILKKMGRKYNTCDIINLLQRIKKAFPVISVTTDIIAGFPGETQESFKNTVKFLKNIGIRGMHVFPFSARPGTRAYDMKDNVPAQEIKERKEILRQLDIELRKTECKKYLNQVSSILIESRGADGRLYGMTPQYIKAGVPYKKGLINKIIEVKLKKVNDAWPVIFEAEYL
ncbi:MAG: tRNA (N(6)-L-threonylcarbamoyladenosine(37)-C(2))-methylthiotransferase MtaB [Elusimicrobiota bacterium]